MTDRQAWFCPACQKHHAPHVDTCPGAADAIGAMKIPTGWFEPSPLYRPIYVDPGQIICGGMKVKDDPNLTSWNDVAPA